jgi:hypothetical protein
MKGYVQNTGGQAYFILQRQIPPNGKVQLSDAYLVVGKKSGLEESQVQEFVNFLQTEILTRGAWSFFEEEGKPFGSGRKAPARKKKAEPKKKTQVTDAKTSSKRENDAHGAGRSMRRDVSEGENRNVTPAAIIEAPYDQARTLIEKTKDRVVLKKALNLTKHFSNKEQHMRHIVKRLEQVY